MYRFSDLTRIKRACSGIFENEVAAIINFDGGYQDIDLTDTQIDSVSESIAILPNECRESLISHICFGFSTDEIGKIFKIDDPQKAYASALTILGYSISLKDGQRIAMMSLCKACNKAFAAFVANVESEPRILQSDDPKTDVAKKRTSVVAVILKRVALFLLGILLCGTVTLSVSAELRERFFEWVVTTYEKYSSFSLSSDGDVAPLDISQVEISLQYIPESFDLSETDETKTRKRVRYLDQAGNRISLTVLLSDTEDNLNTENVSVESVLVRGQEGMRWTNNNVEFVVWEQEGYMLSLITDLDQETAMKIAENIRIL